MTGFWALGENLTQLTQSVWQSSWRRGGPHKDQQLKKYMYISWIYLYILRKGQTSDVLIAITITTTTLCLNSYKSDKMKHTWMVYLHTPSVFHSLIVLSLDPETICRLSAEKATLKTSLVCPTNLLVVTPSRGRKDIVMSNHHACWGQEERTGGMKGQMGEMGGRNEGGKRDWPVLRSHSLKVASQLPDKANWPSEEITTSDTKWLWPLSARLAIP